MKNIKFIMKVFVRDTSGATAIEYGLIAGSMGLMVIPVASLLADTVKESMFDILVGLFA
jgi:Flp pilus assembly pilin Flp